MKREEAAKTVYKLWKKGFVDITPSNPPKTPLRYIFSLESAWFQALTILLIATVLSVFYVKDPPLIYVRYVLGSLFVLYLPGFTLIETLYPRGDELEPLERLALSIGLSLALVPLVGLILNYTPWGIRLTPITLSLALLSEALAVAAVLRKYGYFKLQLES